MYFYANWCTVCDDHSVKYAEAAAVQHTVKNKKALFGYFDLATAMGHFYWMVKGSPVGEPRPGYHDIRVDVSDLEQTLTQVSDKAGETSEIGT